ncbi:spore coat protein [Mesobacillus zeae]|uniref:Spore coat protein n=1 Tax=Mesobacillus zeae TaxID=1917180 RepID=A0A398B4L9_9BACI|nr:spore coat protein [Mesobacillus zeae]RID83768.1 spore coat protein [Mesobacillus zeae]
MAYPNHLAWHETMELHELVAFQTIVLRKLKMNIGKINDPELQKIYQFAIGALESNLRDLLRFYPHAAVISHGKRAEAGFYAGDILGAAKISVRTIALTETATPALREVLKQHLNTAVDWHAMIFNYMYQRGLYPAYN